MDKKVLYENTISFDNDQSLVGHLVTDSAASGILNFTVFNEAGNIIAQRLTFLNNHEYLDQPVIAPTQSSLQPRSLNTIDINFPTASQRSLSVSVMDVSAVAANDGENIYSRLLLTGDVDANIPNPASYFQSNADSLKQQLDSWMITLPETKYNWTKLNKKATAAPKENYLLTISGNVRDAKDNQPVSNGNLSLFIEADDSTVYNIDSPVNDAGAFMVDSLLFKGGAKVYYSYMTPQGKPKDVIAVTNDNPLEKQGLFAIDTSAAVFKRTLTQPTNPPVTKKETKYLEAVVTTRQSSAAAAVNEQYTSGLFRSSGKIVIDNINEPYNNKSLSVVDYIQQSIRTVRLNNGRFLNTKNFSLGSGQLWPIDLLLDQSPVNVANLKTMNMSDVALIKFFEAGFIGASSSGPGGAIAVYSKNNKDKQIKKPVEKVNFFTYNGYSMTAPFINADYNKPSAFTVADNRQTLHWNPAVFTDANTSTFRFSFYTGDATKAYKIVVEGIDANGKLIHAEKVVNN